jgi:hypothetical protein
MFHCEICNTTYTRISVLRTHFNSIVHKQNILRIELLNNQLCNIADNNNNINNIVLPLQSDRTDINVLSQSLSDNIENTTDGKLAIVLVSEILDENNDNQDSIQLDEKTKSSAEPGESLQSNKEFKCFGCDKRYAQKPNLYRHHKTCDIYIEAYKLSKKSLTDIEIAANLIKNRNLCKIIPQLKFDETMLCKSRDTQIQTNVSNNNTMNNNITINNTINVGNWETINFIRPFLHEDISHLYTKENRLKIIASGNNAVNTVINLIYSKPENDNLYRYNSRRNLVKTPDINGQLISYQANEAFAKLAMCILDITDEIMTKSEDILAEYPQYRRGVETYIGTNNWNGEGGNNRYKEYEKNIEMKFETSHKKSETNITMFENEKYKILQNGGRLNFNLESLNRLKAILEPDNDAVTEYTSQTHSQ